MTTEVYALSAAAEDGFDVVWSFGPFRLYPVERRLERSGESIAIGSRALDILVVLVKEAGSVINKRTLMTKAWKNIVVDESNLRVNIGLLRKILGEGENGARYVANVPGRGYSFVAKVTRLNVMARLELKTDQRASGDAVPRRSGQMVGRGSDLCLLANAILLHRCVSIIGSGGLGKSMLAAACASHLQAEFSTAVHYLNLDSLGQAQPVVPALLTMFGLEQDGADPVTAIAAKFVASRAVLILDNCDGFLEGVATLVEALSESRTELHVLVTIREALRVDGEFAYRLGPLDVPPRELKLSAVEARAYSAVELFIDKCLANGHLCELPDEEVAQMIEICLRLDANPLAITLAASRVATFGLTGTLALLDSSCRLHWTGRRNAVSRHRTLEALLDYSFHALNAQEQALFLRLADFVGVFSLSDVQAMDHSDLPDFAMLMGVLDALVGKSLLVPQSTASGTMDFRLLETVRIYALEKTIKREGGKREATLHYEHSGHGQSPWCSAAKPDLELEPFNLFGNAAL